MAYLKKNQQDIYNSLVADLRRRMPEITDFEQGSVIRTMLETIAFEQAVFYEQLDYVHNASFVNSATGLNLEKVVAILDVTRNEPDFALGKVTFYKEKNFSEEIIIPIGTQIITKDNPRQNQIRKSYFTIEEGVIGLGRTSAEVKVQADTRGREMEVGKDELIILPRPLKGIERVNNEEAIKFAGRNKETDDELRLRAKKALLAAGRASETSIEQALLAMPNVLDVKVMENGPGTIKVYVDGLLESNSKDLFTRLNEVRAAGIYAQLAPAEIKNVNVVFKIIPHEDVIAAEISNLEANVADTISTYISSGKMGQAFSILQLNAAILGVKGVKDIDRQEIIFSSADLPVITNPLPGDFEKEPVKELIGFKVDGTPVYKIPADTRNIFFSEVGRFYPEKLRIAAGQKKLPLQFQVKLNYPNLQSSKIISGKVDSELKARAFTANELMPGDLTISKTTIDKYLQLVSDYYNILSTELLSRVTELRVDPLGDKDSLLLAWLKNTQHPELINPDATGTLKSFSSNEAAFNTQVYALIKTDMSTIVKTELKNLIQNFTDQKLVNFSGTQVASDFLSDVTLDLKKQAALLKKEITEQNQQISNTQLLIIGGTLNTTDLAQKRTDLTNFQKTLVEKQVQQDDVQNKLNSLTDILKSLLDKWSNLVRSKILELTQDKQLNTFTNSISKNTDFDLSLRLRTFTFENIEYFRTPIPISFIETPSFDYLWVYARDLRIAGTLKLDLPLTLSAQEKDKLFTNVKNAVNMILYNQLPEEDIEIEKLLAAAQKEEKVLGASFVKGTLGLTEEQVEKLQLLPDRVTDKAIKVSKSEKVLLSDRFFKITD